MIVKIATDRRSAGMPSDDEWRDYESIPSMAPFPDADGRGTWVEVPVRCRVKGTGSLRAWRLEPPPPERMVRLVGTGSLVVQGGYAVVTAKGRRR